MKHKKIQLIRLTINLINIKVQTTKMKKIDGYMIHMNKLLGKGSFGSVYIGQSDKTQQKVAVKILSKSDIDADQYLKNALFSEIKIMECIKSENVVGFYDVMESSKNYYIVQELCDGDLSSIMKGGNTVNQNDAKQYLRQIANGFLALVKEGVIHRDLKPANIMTKGKQLKIGDFGFAKKSQAYASVRNQTIVGTPLYMSLQILKGQNYSSKCDIWALGFIYYEMLHGYPPWNGKSQYDLIKKIQTKPLETDNNLSEESRDFLKRCLQVTEQKRISWDQLFVHPIFKKYFLNKAKGNNQFQNKLKTIMSDLRFQINSQNIDLCKVLASLGYKSGQSQLDKDRFYKFLQIINPDITKQASDYIFIKTDQDKSGTISINEIEKIMNENNINISTVYNKVPGFAKNQNGTQSFNILNPQTENKIKSCFSKLMTHIIWNNKNLKSVFNEFDTEKKGKMTLSSFKKMLTSVNKEINDDEIKAAFDLIDQDGSKTVEYNELNNYYTKVNGIPNIQQKQQPQQNINHNESFTMEDQSMNSGGYYGQNYGQNRVYQANVGNLNKSIQNMPQNMNQGCNHYNPYQGFPNMQNNYPPQNQNTAFNPFNVLMGQQSINMSPPPYQQQQQNNPFLYNQNAFILPQQHQLKPKQNNTFDNFFQYGNTSW